MAETDEPNEEFTPAEPPSRTGRLLGGRPLTVVAILIGGALVLAALLAVVIVTGRTDNPGPTPLTCLPVSLAQAEASVHGGLVDRVTVLTEKGKPDTGPLAVSLDLSDGNCRELPKGVPAQDELYRFIGVVTVFNQVAAGERRIRLVWEEQGNIPAEILATVTPIPTSTPTPSPTPLPTATAPPTAPPAPTLAPTAVPAAAPTAAPTATAPPATPPPTATPRPRPTVTPPRSTPSPPPPTTAPPLRGTVPVPSAGATP